jgi:4-amino-4-deoxy-L-arabinose transferase-like glycosyltransferase
MRLPKALSTQATSQHPQRADTLLIPIALAGVSFVVFLVTRAGFHTFDGIAYVRDMGKPLSALVLPHHLIYEPTVLGFYRVWQAFGWMGEADAPAQMLSSLAGAGGLAIFYKLAWELSRSRVAALIATLMLALTYGYWFYSVEVDIYLPPLFFLLIAAWLLTKVVKDGKSSPTWRLYAIGLAHAVAILVHQATLFIMPAFALGLWLIPEHRRERLLRVVRYALALAGAVIPAYIFAGAVVAGQNTPEAFLKWVNSYGNLGTWGALTADTPANTLSGLSAAVSAEYWTGRALVFALFAAALTFAKASIRKGGAFAWTLWAWTATYLAFFAWWQPEVLKFWVLVLPAPLLLLVMAVEWNRLTRPIRLASLSVSGLVLATLFVTNAPQIWAKRDPLSDPARHVSDALSHLTGQEDLIVLQAGGAEHYLPFYYNRINVMSTRELWYLLGGLLGRDSAIANIKQRAWHALAKGASVWIEDRVVTPGSQAGDHYVFDEGEAKNLLDLYGEPAATEQVIVGPETFYKLSPSSTFSKRASWQFEANQAGWSGVNISGETFDGRGWCFAPMNDPNLYGPPLRADANAFTHLEISMSSGIKGSAQLFYRDSPQVSYSEDKSYQFNIVPGEQTYVVSLADSPSWSGTIAGLRLDPLAQGIPTSPENRVCIREIKLLP